MSNFKGVKPVIVLGTGRSGTSILAGMLHTLGVDMGEKFVPTDINNPLGYWEDVEFTNLNRDYIAKRLDFAQWKGQTISLIKRRVARHAENGDVQFFRWGLKIPANTNLLPEYKELLPDAQYIVIKRDIEETKKSIMRCYDWDEGKAEHIINLRNTMLNEHLPEGSLVIDLEEMIKNTTETVSEICKYLDINPTEEQIQDAISMVNRQDKESKVMVAIPNLGYIHAQLAYRLMSWQRKDLHVWLPTNLKPVEHARNVIARHFLTETDCTHLLMIDADTIPPEWALDSMLMANKPVVSGVTPTMKRQDNSEDIEKTNMVFKKDADGKMRSVKDAHGVVKVDEFGGS